MLIKLVNQSDEEKWENFISRHPDASPYHSIAWKKAIENSYSHRCFYLIAEDESGIISGVLPSVLIKPPLGPAQLCSLPYCDRGEALVTAPGVEQALISKANDIADSHNALYEYRASQKVSDKNKEEINSGQKVRMLLELPGSSETLLANFKAKLRSQIKKAEKNGLEFELGRGPGLIDDFYHVFTVNMKDLGSPTHSKKWFEQISEHFNENMIISIVRYKGIPVGAGIVLFNGEVAAIPWASTKREYNKLAPNMLLYWSLLKYSTDKGYKVFDFGRSSFAEGTYKFKKQWGAQPLPLNWKIFRKKQPQPQQALVHSKGNIRGIVENLWSHLPLPLTVVVGSRIRKYISL